MIHPDTIRIATAVRRAMEQEFPRCKRLKDRCLLASYILSFLLRGAGIKSSIVFGEWIPLHLKRIYSASGKPHVWVLLGQNKNSLPLSHEGTIVDLTLTQFLPQASPVSVLSCPAVGFRPLQHLDEERCRVDIAMSEIGCVFSTARIIERAVALL